jgi:hypothetical protein
LEIQARAKKFMELFTEHFQLYNELLPTYIKVEPRFKQYLKYTIQRRMKPNEAVKKINDPAFGAAVVRDKIISSEVERLAKSRRAITQNIALIIIEFDRWNNWRILPKDVQEPSAFKRRNKNADKKNIKNLLTLPEFTIKKIIERYRSHGHSKKEKVAYIPVFSKFITPEQSIIKVRNTNKTLHELGRIGIYAFASELRAQKLFDLLYAYDIEESKHCTQGQKFWPQYRQAIRHSLNYNMIQKRIPSRKYLESALKDMDIQILNPKNRDPNASRRLKKRVIFD